MRFSVMKRMSGVAWIWLIFGIMFIVLGCIHVKAAGKNATLFPGVEVQPVGLDAVFISEVSLANVNSALEKFRNKFNLYIESYNKSSRDQNFCAAAGYYAASFLAFLSMALEIKSRKLQSLKPA